MPNVFVYSLQPTTESCHKNEKPESIFSAAINVISTRLLIAVAKTAGVKKCLGMQLEILHAKLNVPRVTRVTSVTAE